MPFQTVEEISSFLGYEQLAAPAIEIAREFLSSTHDAPFLERAALDVIFAHVQLDDLHQQSILKAYDVICNDQDLNMVIQLLRELMVIKGHPSHWYVRTPHVKHPLITDALFQLMTILSVVPFSIAAHQQRGVDPKHATFNLGHLANYIKNHHQKHQEVGIENFGWCTYLASLGLIQLGSLNFMHHIYTNRFYIFKSRVDDQIMVLAEAGIEVRKDGQINGVNGINDLAFQTTFEESDTDWIGYYVHPKGYITQDIIRLDKALWCLEIKQGDPVIDFHIPTRMGYRIDDIKDAFMQAKSFFKTYYKEHNYKAFWCVSWLYSPQIESLIENQDSNILNVARQGYICPATPGEQSFFSFIFHTETPDFKTIQPKTSLERAIIDYTRHRGKLNTGLFIYMLSDVLKFGNMPYRTSTQ